MQKITKNFFKKYFPRRAKSSYKNLNGRVLIAAGSANMPGAAVLCARACYRAGAGLVTLAVPSQVYNAAVKAVPEAVILHLPCKEYLNASSLKSIISHNKKFPHDLLVAGPGLGKGAQIVLKLLAQTKLPAVIDADALNFLAQKGVFGLDKNIPHILTPHAGEMKRLLKAVKITDNSAKKLSQITDAIAILKGPFTKVCYKEIIMQNTTGNEGLAKAGSGDVLAGIIGGIWAQLIKKETGDLPKQKAFKAAALGVYLHGAAADEAVKKISKTALMASEIYTQIPRVILNTFQTRLYLRKNGLKQECK
ncbi:MAG: NAD(P)H-hydrate dehydratase [Elusimicrobiota bacterium]|jgi:NAD(P)H-hydrate epimerase|nr:NAD(P)H-hydrate dehydratase [Elusimicrobiota bacterium]